MDPSGQPLIFKRGFFAEEWARKNRGQPSGLMQLGAEHAVVDAFSPGSTFDASKGALAISFVGRYAKRAERVHVILGRDGLRFSTRTIEATAVEPGWYPVRVPQSRIGVNVGAVAIMPGYVTILEYRPNIWGTPGGKFDDSSAAAVPIEVFLDWRAAQTG